MAGDYGIGSLVGGIGGLISGYQQRAAATRGRRRTRKASLAATAQAKSAAEAILKSPEYSAGANFIRTFFGVRPQPAATAPGTTRAVTPGGSPGFNPYAMNPEAESATAQAPFLDPLTENYLRAGNIVGQQSGLEGFAPAAAQTAGLASFKFQQQLNLLPQLMELGAAPQMLQSNLYNQFYTEQARNYGVGSDFGPSPMTQGFLGGLTAYQAGGGLGQFGPNYQSERDQLLNQYLRQQVTQSGGGRQIGQF